MEYYPNFDFTGVISLAREKESGRERLILWVMRVLFGGCDMLGYIVAWIIMPEEPLRQASQASPVGVSAQAAPNR